jgi:hypothetical protein
VSRRKQRQREVAQTLADLAAAKDPAEVLAALVLLAERSPLVLVLVLRKAGRQARRLGLVPDLLP